MEQVTCSMAATLNLSQESLSSTPLSNVPPALRPVRDAPSMLVVSDLFLREREISGRPHHMVDITNPSEAVRSSAIAEGRAFHSFTPIGRIRDEDEPSATKTKRKAKEVADHKRAGTTPMVRTSLMPTASRMKAFHHSELTKSLRSNGRELPADGKFPEKPSSPQEWSSR